MGREQDCIDLYKSIEANHPIKKIRSQAENLRYIMEAPKLELSPDERVTIPLIQSDTWRKDGCVAGWAALGCCLPVPYSMLWCFEQYW